MNETLEKMARVIFKSWFVDFAPVVWKATRAGNPVPDRFAKTAERYKNGASCRVPDRIAGLFPDAFEESELGHIPKGWKVGRLGDVSEHTRRSLRPEQIEPKTPYIALEHMPKRCIALAEWGTSEALQSNKYEFRREDILFGKLRPYFHKVGVAPVDGVTSTSIFARTLG